MTATAQNRVPTPTASAYGFASGRWVTTSATLRHHSSAVVGMAKIFPSWLAAMTTAEPVR
jgi:hypothetical protein